METLKSRYTDVTFVNLSISSLGNFGLSCSSFIEMCDALAVDMGHCRNLISKLSNTIIRMAYYIFCHRNKPWNSPELLCVYDAIHCSFVIIRVVTFVMISNVFYYYQASQL